MVSDVSSRWFAATSPATSAAAEEPSPRATGTSVRTTREKDGSVRPVSCASRFIAVMARFSRPSRRPASLPSRVTSPGSPDGSIVASFQSPRASPRASNPGPRLADEAGVLTVKRIGESLLQRGKLGGDADWPIRSAPRSTVDVVEVIGGDGVGVFQDVPGQESDRGFLWLDDALLHQAAQSRERGGRRRLTTDAAAVDRGFGVEDLLVADRRHPAVAHFDRAPGARRRGRVADLDRGGHGFGANR